MTGQGARPQLGRVKTAVKLVRIEELCRHASEVHDLVAHRAYELYESRGCEAGQELDDWVRAESELLCTVPVGFMQSDHVLMVDAAVPGFDATDLLVNIEPRRITISGKREPAAEAVGRRRPLQVLRVVDLPVEVDPLRATATLKCGILELVVSKAGAARVELKAA